MFTYKGFLISALAATAMVAPSLARADQYFVLYCDSGIAWRIGQHDRELERRQVELNYAQDVLNAKDDYNAAVNAANQSNDQTDMLLAADQRLQNDLQRAEDNRIAALDSLYPNRWNEIGNYPDLILVGYGGPCHVCELDVEGGSIAWLSIFQPYPGYSKPCLFGWQYGQRHRFDEVRSARATYRTRVEANIRLHPSTPADVAFHNANRFVQTRRRADQGRAQANDVTFMSNHHLPPVRMAPPIPRASHTLLHSPNAGSPPSYAPRATTPIGPNGRNVAPPARRSPFTPRTTTRPTNPPRQANGNARTSGNGAKGNGRGSNNKRGGG